jgi:hypothetical protein
MTTITPTLRDLRTALEGGMPPTRTELTFDLADHAPEGYLPDCLVVGRRMCEQALAGEFDGCPDATPLETLSEAPG